MHSVIASEHPCCVSIALELDKENFSVHNLQSPVAVFLQCHMFVDNPPDLPCAKNDYLGDPKEGEFGSCDRQTEWLVEATLLLGG